MKRIAVLVSGRGTNLQALIDAQKQKQITDGCIVLVISNNPLAPALQRAQEAAIKTVTIDHREYKSREDHEQVLITILRENKIDLIILAGYMRILSPKLINSFPNAIVNIHPALLPAFPGMHAQQQAIDYGVKVTGITTHFVTAQVDAGPIIQQKAINILNTDTVESLSQRMLEEEHQLLTTTVELLCTKRITIQDRRVIFNDK